MKTDFHTTTLEGAEAFERLHSERIEPDLDYCETETEIDEDYCGCSDPGCPCEGGKRGAL